MKWRERTIDFDSFVHRHIGPNQQEIDAMLAKVGFEDLDALIDAAIPKNIRLDRRLDLPEAKSEREALAELSALARKTKSHALLSAQATPTALHHQLFSETSLKIPAGIRLTRPTRRKSRKAGSKHSSISKRW